MRGLIGTGLAIGVPVGLAMGIIIGWIIRTRLPTSWALYDTLIRWYVRELALARIKARAALAMWDDGDLSGARRTLVEIAQLGENK